MLSMRAHRHRSASTKTAGREKDEGFLEVRALPDRGWGCGQGCWVPAFGQFKPCSRRPSAATLPGRLRMLCGSPVVPCGRPKTPCGLRGPVTPPAPLPGPCPPQDFAPVDREPGVQWLPPSQLREARWPLITADAASNVRARSRRQPCAWRGLVWCRVEESELPADEGCSARSAVVRRIHCMSAAWFISSLLPSRPGGGRPVCYYV